MPDPDLTVHDSVNTSTSMGICRYANARLELSGSNGLWGNCPDIVRNTLMRPSVRRSGMDSPRQFQ